MQQLETLAIGAFLETATNVLAFGLPGVGKSHALSAVGHALVEAGHSVLCAPAYALVQELLGAKRDLDLPRALRKLDLFEVILLDDLGYVQQSPDEAEVLFTLRNRPPGGFASTCGRVVCVHTCGSVHSPRRGVAPGFRVAYGWEDVGEGPGTSGPS